MSMKVNSDYMDYKNDYSKRLQEEREKAKEVESIPIPKDEYISSEQSGSRPSGLYHIGKDENGNPKVLAEKCTTNTDKVDREIKKLKEQKQQLEQQIKTASEEEEKVKELERKLSQVESELSKKDNDTYRRQNAVIS